MKSPSVTALDDKCGMKKKISLRWRRLYLGKAKLKASSQTSALMSGFAMTAMVEIHLQENLPKALLIIFGACTTLLVTIHLMALMISTCILPKIDAASSDMEDETALIDSPHEKLRIFVELAWICSTGLGIILFLVEIAILSWVKFLFASPNAAIACTVIVIPALILFITFSLVYYRRLIALKYQLHEEELNDLETITHDLIHNNIDKSGAQACYVV